MLDEDPRFSLDLSAKHAKQLPIVGAAGKGKEFKSSSLSYFGFTLVLVASPR
jgi:hypothetical protein